MQSLAGFDPIKTDLAALAKTVLLRLASTEPVSLRTLKAEVESELALTCRDRAGLRRVAGTLVGALLLDVGAGPSSARPCIPAWANEQTGVDVVPTAPFDVDPVAACAEQVRAALAEPGSRLDSSVYTPRHSVEATLGQFLAAPETAFVLLGRSGVGKSWVVGRWAAEDLQSPRLLVARPEFRPPVSLGLLVADALS